MAKRRRRQHLGVRAAPRAEVLPPEAILADDPPPVAADADDSLPPDLEFEPVPRQPRSNGLTPVRQRLFVKYVAMTGSVTAACRVIGCSTHAVYHLRNSPGAESFAEAWERAVERGARRVRDVMLEQAIEGIPEKIYKDGQLVAERRVFNTRAQMWIVSHTDPEKYGVGRYRWARNGAGAAFGGTDADDEDGDDAGEAILWRLSALRTHFKRSIADDPAKRAAWELLIGPTDWDNPDRVVSDGEWEGMSDTNMNRPDMILTLAAPLGENGEMAGDVLFGGGARDRDG